MNKHLRIITIFALYFILLLASNTNCASSDSSMSMRPARRNKSANANVTNNTQMNMNMTMNITNSSGIQQCYSQCSCLSDNAISLLSLESQR